MTLRSLQQNIAWLSVGKKMLSFLICALLVLSFLYGYFVSMSVINVLVRKEIERDIATVGSRISTLEAQYLLQKNEISHDFANAQGFFPISDKHFVTRASGGPSAFTLNND